MKVIRDAKWEDKVECKECGAWFMLAPKDLQYKSRFLWRKARYFWECAFCPHTTSVEEEILPKWVRAVVQSNVRSNYHGLK